MEVLARALGNALSPLQYELTPERVLDLFARMGLQLPSELLGKSAFTTALTQGAGAAEDLGEDVVELAEAVESGDAMAMVQKGLALLEDVVVVIEALDSLADALTSVANQLPNVSAAQVQAFAQDFARKLVDQLLAGALERQRPAIAGILVLAGVIERAVEPGNPADPASPPYVSRKLRLERLLKLLTSPLALANEVYGWNGGTFNAALLASRFQQFLKISGLPAGLKLPPEVPKPQVESLLFGLQADGSSVVLTLLPPIEAGFDFMVAPKPGWTLHVTTTGQLPAGATLTFTPPSNVAVSASAGPLTAELKTTLDIEPVAPAKALVLLGQAGASRLETAGMSFGLGFAVKDTGGGTGTGEPTFHARIDDGKVIIESGKGGGLLSQLLSSLRIEAGFDLEADWRPSTGLRFKGGAGIEVRIPTSFTLGPIELQSIYLRSGIGAGGSIPLELSTGLRVALGPLTITVDRMGVEGALTFPNGGGGNLGPANLALGFKPPNGLGLSVEAGPVSGGGFLDFQSGPPERYAGALALRLMAFSVSAYGLFEKTQSGKTSFVVVLGARFTPGFQVGFGFAITGVGGLVGVNRRANVDLLAERLSSGTAGNVLFAENPVQSAPTLLGDLAELFPAADGVFVVGPTFQVTWMSLVRLDLGVLIEFPGPSKIILLGVGRFELGGQGGTPALVQIRLDVLGVIDFEQKLVSFDAALVNSRLLQIFHLTGSAGFRLSTGDRPYVMMTVGGFHPAFNPEPAHFPPLSRVGLTFNTGGGIGLSLRLEAYLAITSNTFQVGAALEVKVEAGPLNALGFLAFDALIQFKPFYFNVRFSAGFRVRYEGITLAGVRCEGTLTGPGPIVLSGSFTIEILFFEITWSDTFTLGEESGDAVLPVGSLVQALAVELEKPSNLEAIGGEDRRVATSPKTNTGKALISPLGQVAWSQKRAPLDVTLERFEGVPLESPQAVIATLPMASAAVQDWFSPGTFVELSGSESLNKGAFERLDAGRRVGFDLKKSAFIAHPLQVKTVRLPHEVLLLKLFLAFPPNFLEAALGRRAAPSIFAAAPAIAVKDETWAVQGKDGDVLKAGTSQTDAHQRARYSGAVALPALEVAEPIDLGGI
ncbi:hypothetical protein MFUL124B02_30910 [Myxococcus fulvus 124B02]|nr:hypothetical protein MFUL124B02_30910 [Myxococcus fulvus 124B02]